MRVKAIAMGEFLAVTGIFYFSLRFATDALVFEPTAQPTLDLAIGGLLLVAGLLLPQ